MNEEREERSERREITDGRTTRVVVYMGALSSVVLTVAVLFAILGGGPSHQDIMNRLADLERNQTIVVCLLQITPEERTEEVIAACLAVPPE